MKFAINKSSIILIVLTLLIAAGTLAGIILPNQDSLLVQALRIGFGSVFILFLPGYFLTRAFFSSDEIDILERFALSFALSISVVPLLMFYTNLVGLGITALNVYAIAIAVILFSSIYTAFFHTKSSGVQHKKNIAE